MNGVFVRSPIVKIQVLDIQSSLRFYSGALGFTEIERRSDSAGRRTMCRLHLPDDPRFILELRYEWDPNAPKKRVGKRKKLEAQKENCVSLCFSVENLSEVCEKIRLAGGAILRQAQDGSSILTRCPDHIPVELLRCIEKSDGS